MAGQIVALTCDCCGKGVDNPLYIQRCSRDTAVASFKYDLCLECVTELEEVEPEVRDLAYRQAMVTHASRFSEGLGVIAADLLKVEVPRPLEPLAKAA